MLQLWLRILLATELVIYLALGGWMYTRGFAALPIAFTILLIAILWRLSHATGSFVVASILRRREGSSEPPGTAWKAWVGECSARFVSFNWSQPFSEYVMGADPVVAGQGQPVILVHGYFSSRGDVVPVS